MFITFEGLDGSGKTTQARLLGARLEAEGVEVVLTREPGGTPLGEEIRDLVLHGGDVAPWAEAALYAASRAQHVEQLIRPALARGATVICDRYVDSSVAYQGIARGLGLERVLELNLAAVEGLMPDRTILLEIGADDAVGRMGGERDRIEREDDGFHARVAARVPAARRARMPGPVRDRRRHRRARRAASPRRSMEPFARVPEQTEAKRLLTAALADGDAHAFLFHGPAGVGKTAAAFAFAGALLGDARRVVRADAPGPAGRRAARRHDPHRRRSASCTTTCTCGRSRRTAASTSCSAPTCSTTTRPTRC